MKRLFLSLTLALLLILSVAACTKELGGSENTTAEDTTLEETVTATEGEGSDADPEESSAEETAAEAL